MKQSFTRFLGSSAIDATPVWSTGSSLGSFNGYATFNQSFAATSPISAPITYSVVGSLPTGLTLSGTTVSGRVLNPSGSSEVRTFTLRASTGSLYADRTFSMTVNRVSTTDPYADQVLFYFRGNGNYSDTSAYGRTISTTSPNTNMQVQTTEKKYGSGSFEFRGSSMLSTQDMRIPASPDFNLGTDSFTLEWWARPSSTQQQYSVWIVTAAAPQGTNATADLPNSISIWAQPKTTSTPESNKLGFNFGSAGAFHGSVNVNDNTWRHFAIVRNGSVVTAYIDGVADVTIPSFTGTMDLGTQYGIRLGFWVGTDVSNRYRGYLDEIRLTKAARYTSNFTPPTAEFAYP